MLEITQKFQELFFDALKTKNDFWKILATYCCDFSHDNAKILFPKLHKVCTVPFSQICRIDVNDAFVDWIIWVGIIIEMKKESNTGTW